MQKSVLVLLFFFGALVGGWLYIEKTYFAQINACLDAGGGWNSEEQTCTTGSDVIDCKEKGGIWIAEENLCDYGERIN